MFLTPALKEAATAKSAACARLRTVVEDHLPKQYQDEDTAVSINELRCAEEGCPPVETVVTVLRKPAPAMFKIYKAAVDVTEAEVIEGLAKMAAADGVAAASRVRGGAPDGAPEELVGVYDFEYAGGKFDVHLRTKGKFFCQNYQMKGSWRLEGEPCPYALRARAWSRVA